MVNHAHKNLNSNILCAIGIRTTGPKPDEHEIYDLCIIPITAGLDISPDFDVFHVTIMPERLETIKRKKFLDGVHFEEAVDRFQYWFDSLGLRPNKKIIPLAYNYPVVDAFMSNLMTDSYYRAHFASQFYRDILPIAEYINDRRAQRRELYQFQKTQFQYILAGLDLRLEYGQYLTAPVLASKTLDVYRALLLRAL
jgi:hypothetical protein